MIFEPLYSPDLGLAGFRCRCGACTRVVRTQRGAEMHCWRKHKIKAQMEMDYEATTARKPEPLPAIGTTLNIKRPERFKEYTEDELKY